MGAGLEVAVDAEEHLAHVGEVVAAFAVAVPASLVLLTITQLRRFTWGPGTTDHVLVALSIAGMLGSAALAGVVGVGVSVLLQAVVLAGVLTVYLLGVRRRRRVST